MLFHDASLPLFDSKLIGAGIGLSFLFGGAIAGFLGVGFGHVFAMFGFAVPVRAGLVVNAGVAVANSPQAAPEKKPAAAAAAAKADLVDINSATLDQLKSCQASAKNTARKLLMAARTK